MRKRIIRLTESELTNLIHRIVVETKDQHSDMDEMYEIDDMEEGELDEGLFGPSKEEKEQRKNELMDKINALLDEEGIDESELVSSVNSVLRKAEEDNFDGEVKITYGRRGRNEGRPMIVFRRNPTKFEKSGFYKNVVRPMVGGMRGGHEFGSGE